MEHKRTETILLHRCRCEDCNWTSEALESSLLATASLANHIVSKSCTGKVRYIEELPMVVEVRRHYVDTKRKDSD